MEFGGAAPPRGTSGNGVFPSGPAAGRPRASGLPRRGAGPEAAAARPYWLASRPLCGARSGPRGPSSPAPRTKARSRRGRGRGPGPLPSTRIRGCRRLPGPGRHPNPHPRFRVRKLRPRAACGRSGPRGPSGAGGGRGGGAGSAPARLGDAPHCLIRASAGRGRGREERRAPRLIRKRSLIWRPRRAGLRGPLDPDFRVPSPSPAGAQSAVGACAAAEPGSERPASALPPQGALLAPSARPRGAPAPPLSAFRDAEEAEPQLPRAPEGRAQLLRAAGAARRETRRSEATIRGRGGGRRLHLPGPRPGERGGASGHVGRSRSRGGRGPARRMAPPAPRLGRKRPLPACANPLFERWLREWRDEAAGRGLRTRFVYQKALRSLRRYPLPLSSGREAGILQHFGDALCRRLDGRLERLRAGGPGLDMLPVSELPRAESSRPSEDAALPQGGPDWPTAGRHSSYRPPRGSAARALLLILYKEQLDPKCPGSLTKEELLRRWEQDAPRVALSHSSQPWPALRTLLHRSLIQKTQQPARYSLTPKGLELSQKLAEAESLQEPLAGLGLRSSQFPGREAEDGPQGAGARLTPAAEPPLELGPGEYRILLCVDISETTGSSHRPQILRELQRLGVPYDVRKLHVGDFVWVAQETRPREPTQPSELVLDHVVERKRLDDLCNSITDGRFREQKFRLKRCGLSQRVYLVEDHGSAHSLSLPESTLLQAVTNTQVIDGFFVKRTTDLKESAAYLALLTRALQRLYVGQTLRCRPWGEEGDPGAKTPPCSLFTFRDFNEGAMKNKAQSVSEVFARQLMQVRGVSGEKAAALLEKYSTPASLLAAYDACAGPQEQEKLLSSIKCGRLQRNLGPALSRTLCQLYCTPGPLP
ncbi:crossover junction endonuclease MUS81 isoform X2 [Macrotis lagotis]|uniref:crossover junction endonuclease MUS81 isoform X2 n=1 Tax=Macrotis lagotis TaxID=92651 RepID=UPI003D69CD12